jgi:hypothetical protein
MGVTAAITGSATPTLAKAASPSEMPAQPARPVAGCLALACVAEAAPVRKDGSKPPDGPRGPLVSASELQSISDRSAWDKTDAAIAEVRRAEHSYEEARAGAESGDSGARRQLDGRYSAFKYACKALKAAVDNEIQIVRKREAADAERSHIAKTRQLPRP